MRCFRQSLSILFMRFHPDDPRKWKTVVKLSILFMRFTDSGADVYLNGHCLSILFMRFTAIPILERCGYTVAFNSLYEIQSNVYQDLWKRLDTFQFSLWDSDYQAFGERIMVCSLSILFMRFTRVSFGIEYEFDFAFNSLYEIPLFHYVLSEKDKSIDFQFSLWDSPLKNASNVLRKLFTFNSLYEIHYATCARKLYRTPTSFNSLYEIPI